MYKLLKANSFRLKKDVVFWLFICASIGIAIFEIWQASNNMQRSFMDYKVTVDEVISEFVEPIGLAIGLFVSLFIGNEFSSGIIRNKIISGHKREKIYLSYLINIIISVIIAWIIYSCVILVVGRNIFEKSNKSLSEIIITMINIILNIVCFCSMFLLITMVFSDPTINVILCVMLFFMSFLFISNLSLTVNATPYKLVSNSFTKNGEITDVVIEPNNLYIENKTERNIVKSLYFLLPPGQAGEINYSSYYPKEIKQRREYLNTLPLYSIFSTCFMSFWGICIFKNKDLK